MVEQITKEDIIWLYEVTLLNFESKPLTELISMIKPKHIIIGRKVLDLIQEEWEKQ